MKTLISVLFALFVCTLQAQAQTTGFALTDSAKIYSTSATLSDTSVSGKSYRFDLSGFYSGPDSLSSNAIWTKSHAQRSIPMKIVVDMMSPAYATGVTRIAVGLDTLSSGPIRGIANSGFIYVYPGSGWVTKTFVIHLSPGATWFKRLGFSFSLIQGETGLRVVFVDNIRVVSASGDTTMLDDGSGIISIPPVPSLVSPTNGATGISATPTLTWNISTGATSYRLQVTLANGNVVFDTSGIIVTFKQVSGLQNNTTYYWRVNATNSSGTSDWSSTWNFTTITGAPTIAPVLNSPTNEITNVVINPTLLWNSVAGATSYEVQVSSGPNGSGNIIFNQSVSGLSAMPTGILCGSTYHWRVRAANSAGNGPWSSSWSFTTVGCIPGVPVLGFPPDGAINQPLNVSLSWGSVSGATSYGVQVIKYPDTTYYSVSGISFIPPNLACGSTYQWRVRAENISVYSAWSGRSFSTIPCIPNAPILTSPQNGATGVAIPVTLAWLSVQNAISYRLQVLKRPTSLVVFDLSGVTSSSYVVSNLEGGQEYMWRVNAINSSGTSDWSTAFIFATAVVAPTSAPSLYSPWNNSTGVSLTPTLGWYSVNNAASYDVEVATSSSFTSVIFSATGVTELSVRISNPLSYATTYYWRVRGRNSGGVGSWSDVWNFMTIGTTNVDESEIPKEFTLCQNYPNPFNPTTTINFELPKNSLVTLKIYNLLGKEVATLVESEKPAGVYEVSFDASKFPTGMYIYQLHAGNFIETKKMILIK